MLLKNVMSTPPLIVNADTTIEETLRLMRDADVGFLPVTHDEICIGAITDDDIEQRVLNAGLPVEQTRVAQVMSSGKCDPGADIRSVNARIVSLPEDATTEEATQLMEDCHIHHLAVCDSEARIIGIVTRDDIIRSANEPTHDNSADASV
ncbi:MAG: CBS domain-containing protein [Planctomycetaceae bacterium]